MAGKTLWVEAHGVALRCRLDGTSGPWLVLIHEMGGVLESWDRVVPVLQDEFRILRFDTRGAGLSEKVRDGVVVEDLADDIAALLDVLGIDEKVTVGGCAVGAGVALSFAQRHPARAASVVVMNPAIGVTDENRVGLLARADTLAQGGARAVVDTSLASGYPQGFRDADPDHFALFKARWIGNDPHSLRALFLMLSKMDLAPLLPQITCPVLGVSGNQDPLRPTSYVREVLSLMQDTSLVVIESGHHIADQAPDALAAAIRDFVRARVREVPE